MFINEETIEESMGMIRRSLIAHIEEIDRAYCESDDEDPNLNISLKIKLESRGNGVLIKTGMSFKTGTIKEEDEKLTYPNQQQIPFNKGEK